MEIYMIFEDINGNLAEEMRAMADYLDSHHIFDDDILAVSADFRDGAGWTLRLFVNRKPQ